MDEPTQDRQDNLPSPRAQADSVRSTDVRDWPLLSGFAACIALFWAAAVAARFFVDRPFAYVFSTEWVEDLVRSSARFPGSDESALFIVSSVLLAPAVVLGTLWTVRRVGNPLERIWASIEASPPQLAAVLGVVAAAGAAFVSFGLIQGATLIDDERAYLFQAETFAHGHLALPAVPAAFRNPMFLTTPVWAAKYPPGHALALLPGVLIGEPHLVPLVLTGLTVVGLYQLMRVFGERQALLAAALFALSPFAWSVGGTLMAFSTNACALVWFFAWLARAETHRGLLFPALAGVAFGWAAITRPFDAVALSLPVFVWLAWRAIRGEVGALRKLLAVALAASPCIAFQLFYNHALTGSALTFPYFLTGDFRLGFTRPLTGFPYVHTPVQAAGHLAVAGMRLDSWLLAFPGSLLLVLVGVLRPRAQTWDRIVVLSVASFVVFYALVPSSGTWDVGPTYYYACAPLLVLIAVRGVHALHEIGTRHWPALSHFASALVVVGPLIALVTLVPLHLVRLTDLAAEIRAPWDTIAGSGIGNAIVAVPDYQQRLAAGYALGYPYEIATGPGTRARLVWPADDTQLDAARQLLGTALPVYQLVANRALFESNGTRHFSLVRVKPSATIVRGR